MAKMSFSASNKANDQEQFPKLKLAQDESARIALIPGPDGEPEVGFVHNIRKPKLIGGEVQYKSVKGKDGSFTQEMEYEFVSNPICLGNFDILQDRGLDPKNCPACKAASDAPDMFQKPKRRYVLHIFQYNTNGTTQATKTFQGSVKIWAFTDQKFNELVDLIEEADGDASNIDIMLGPCENAMYQKFKMVPSMKVKWKESEQATSQFQEITSENKAKNLENFLGRPVKRVEYLEDDLAKVREAWNVVHGRSGESRSDGLESVERNLDAGLANLLDEEKPVVTQSVNSNTTKSDTNSGETKSFDDILASLDED